jgi:hypothetical protein
MSVMLFYIGVFGLGWLLPEFTLAIGASKDRFPIFTNIVSGASCVLIAQFFVL